MGKVFVIHNSCYLIVEIRVSRQAQEKQQINEQQINRILLIVTSDYRKLSSTLFSLYFDYWTKWGSDTSIAHILFVIEKNFFVSIEWCIPMPK